MEQIAHMEHEWSVYMRLCLAIPVHADDVKPQYRMDVATNFWKTNWPNLPNLKLLALYCFTIVPSSGAAERVFSAMKNSLSLLQMTKGLEDYTALSVMCQYNHRND